jgi:large subunit ribosomal protein L6
MTVSVNKNQLIVKNLLGEKIPRVLDLKEGVTVKVEGENIIVESTDKEKAGQCAASIEQLTRRTGYDTRVFQDGCWITIKDKKEIK